REKFSRTQSIVYSFAGYRIGKARSIAEQRPMLSARAARVPRARLEAGNAGRVTFGGFLELLAQFVKLRVFVFTLPKLHSRRVGSPHYGRLSARRGRVIAHHEIPQQLIERVMIECVLRRRDPKRNMIETGKSPGVANPL